MNLKKLLVTFSHSLFWQISAFCSSSLPLPSEPSSSYFKSRKIRPEKASAINVSGSLRMQSYVLALTVARSSEDTEVVRSKDIKTAIAEFEKTFKPAGANSGYS